MTETPTSLPGQIPATVQFLTLTQARVEVPDLFGGDEETGEVYFNDLGSHGNARWADYWPDLLVVVRAPDGRVVMASNASEWHMTGLGYTVPVDTPEVPR